MSKQNNRESDSSQETKNNRADCYRDISHFARDEIKLVASAYKLASFLIASIFIIGIFFTYRSSSDFKRETREEVDRQKNEVSRRIDEDFKKDNINKMVEEKAKSRIDEIADKLIDKQIINKITPQVEAFEALKQSYEEDYQLLSKEIAKLKQRNEIAQLGDKGIIHASRDSLEELERIKNKPENADIRHSAEAEIARVKGFWAGGITRTKGGILTKDEKEKKVSDIKTHELIDALLNDNDWRVRTIVAQELSNRNEKGVPEALLQCIKDDRNLEVIRDALNSFEHVTGYYSPDVFAYGPVQDWWKKHSEEVNASLKDRNEKPHK